MTSPVKCKKEDPKSDPPLFSWCIFTIIISMKAYCLIWQQVQM